MADTPDETPRSDQSVDAIRRYYDTLGEGEHDRLTKDVAGRVSFEVHRRFLAPYLTKNQRVLEVGAGPGRFTTVLAEHGARVVVTDISPVQLHLNEANVAAAGFERA